MNTKKMIAAFAILMMAFVAVAAVPATVDDAADAKEIVYMNGDVTSALSNTPDQKVIIDKDLTVKEGGSVTIQGELLVNEGVKVVIEDGGEFTILGDAIINGSITSKGASGLTISIGGFNNVVINGTVSAMGDTSGTPITSVTISADGTDDCKVLVNGTLYVGTNATISVSGVEIASQGKLAVYGSIQGQLKLAGNAYFESDDAQAANSVEIKFTDASAVVDIKAAYGSIIINDEDMYAYSYGGVQYYIACSAPTDLKKAAFAYDADAEVGAQFTDAVANTISLNNIKNVKITEKVATATAYDESDSTTKMYAETKMILAPLDAAASVEAADALEGHGGAMISVSSGETVYFETMTVYGVSVDIAGEATVSGTVTYPLQPNSEVISVGSDGILNVDGKVEVLRVEGGADGITNGGIINAAVYKVLNTDDNTYNWYYTTLQQAIDDGAKDITILGVLIIEKDTTVPANVKITTAAKDVVDPELYVVIVKEGATLKFVDQSKLVLGGDVNVEGALIFENVDFGITLGDNAIYADVMKKTDAKVEFMNIYVAFAAAVAGDELEAYNPVDGTIVIDKDLTLPALVEFSNVSSTLGDDDGTPMTISVDNGVVFTIAGALYVDVPGNLVAEASGNGWNDKTPATDGNEVKDYSVIKIGEAGLIVFQDRDQSLTGDAVYGEFKIAGAYYQNKTNTPAEDGEFYIANIPLAFAGILNANEYTVGIYGEVTIDSKVTGTDKDRIIIDIDSSAKVTFKDFTFAYGKVTVDDAELTGAIGTSTGKMVFSEATVDGDFEDKFVDNAMNLLVTGSVDSADPTSITGLVYLGEFTYTADWTDAPSTTTAADMRFNVPAGTALMVIGQAAFCDCELLVAGELTVGNQEASLTVRTESQDVQDSLLSVTGILTVAKLDGKFGKLIASRIIVGGDFDSAIIEDVVTGTGSINGAGAFDADSLKQLTLFVIKGASVNMDVLKDWMAADTTKNTEFYVDDALWMTVYVEEAVAPFVQTDYTGVTPVTTYIMKPALDNVEFDSWQTYDAKNKTYKDIVAPTGSDVSFVNVGDAGYDKVYAKLTKDIYKVYVTADVGIDNVYIDGKIMVKYNQYNYFEAEVAAGTHTITYELANGYTGNAYITTIDGKAIAGSGLTFKVSDDNYDATQGYMDITISGIQKSGYDVDPETHPEKSTGLTVTEILLIVVVIIMAIMAVVLILRLNRS